MFGIHLHTLFVVVTLSRSIANKAVVANPIMPTTLSSPLNKNQTNPLMHAIYDAHIHESVGVLKGNRFLSDFGASASDLDAALHLLWKGSNLLSVEIASSIEAANITLRHHLEKYGFETTACIKYTCSGYLDITRFPEVEQLPSVLSIMPYTTSTLGSLRGGQFERRIQEKAPVNSSPFGSIKSNAFEALQINKLREVYPHLTGAGMKIGVLSDSYNTRGTAAADVASGDLPSDVVIVKESSVRRSDEGRAMLQLVHDLAPDATLYFHSVEGIGDMVAGIHALADLGCNVILDDIVDFGQPFFQEGPIAQTASDIAEIRGIPYFSSAGNSGRTSYESAYHGIACGLHGYRSCHDFGGGNIFQRITVSDWTEFILQWDDPFASVSGPTSKGAKTDIDALIFDASTGEMVHVSAFPNIGRDPLDAWVLPAGTYDIAVAVDKGRKPDRIKWITPDDMNLVSVDPPTNSGYIVSQANTLYTAGVGCAFEQQTFSELKVEPFSSVGGAPLLFDRDGSRKAKPLTPNQPRFIGPDGSYNTFFGINVTDPLGIIEPRFRFFGTSAAVPNVAAVALLMLQAAPDLPPSRLYSILGDTAIDMNVRGFDYDSGYGFINGFAAVRTAMLETGSDTDPYDNEVFKKKKKRSNSDGDSDSTPPPPVIHSQCFFTVDGSWIDDAFGSSLSNHW
ncbi:subtilase family protease [Nitzschia inconspicua]|uniref:Subtilase family protease n=1 Tax=Nitzschia inconspicua TaxID=303405 RepID=A0A9K3KJS9_9STRA|nr:subtilase family protease [Nitzschia inconspicua]